MGKRKIYTYDEVYKGFLEKGLILDEIIYIDPKTKMKCHCEKHPSEIMYYAWQYVRLGRFSCKQCNKENPNYHRYYSNDERISWINDNTDLTFINGDTSKVLNLITVECNHNHQFETTFDAIKKGNTDCPYCKGTKLPKKYWNKQTAQKWLDNNKVKYNIIEFVYDDTKNNMVYIKCDNPNHKPYWTSWAHIVGGNRCKQCYYENSNKKDWTLSRAKQLLKSFGYNMLDESFYISSHNRIPCIDKFGVIYMISIHYLLRGRTGFSLWKGNPYVVHNINLYCKLFRPDYEFISQKYYGNKQIHKWKYIGEFYKQQPFEREFEMTFSKFINSGCRHPRLTMSQLEIEAEKVMDKFHINYETQKTFEGCTYKIKLRYDFYLTDYNICLEMDGRQHELPVEAWGGEKSLEETKKKDKIKNEYCKKNNIGLIRIPYNKINHIQDIILQELQALSISLESA